MYDVNRAVQTAPVKPNRPKLFTKLLVQKCLLILMCKNYYLLVVFYSTKFKKDLEKKYLVQVKLCSRMENLLLLKLFVAFVKEMAFLNYQLWTNKHTVLNCVF